MQGEGIIMAITEHLAPVARLKFITINIHRYNMPITKSNLSK